MKTDRPTSLILAPAAIVAVAAILSLSSNAQAPERTPYSTPPGWSVSTYRSAASGAFLRCSAERHYDHGLTLTVAINSAGKFVLGFTSAEWTYEDRSTHPVSIRVDSSEEMSVPGRVRVLPVFGPIVFVDLDMDMDSAIVPALSAGSVLYVNSAETSLEFDLSGSAAAISDAARCHRDGSG